MILRVVRGLDWFATVRSETLRTRSGVLRPLMERSPVNAELNPLFAHFAHELKRLRVKRGWSQEALGKRIRFSGEMVSKIETGRNAPSPEFADALDRLAFQELEGMFCELLDSAGDWQFRTYADAEQHASVIRMANPLLVPGLLQTEGYIRAVHETWRPVDGNPQDRCRHRRQARTSSDPRPRTPAVARRGDRRVRALPAGRRRGGDAGPARAPAGDVGAAAGVCPGPAHRRRRARGAARGVRNPLVSRRRPRYGLFRESRSRGNHEGRKEASESRRDI